MHTITLTTEQLAALARILNDADLSFPGEVGVTLAAHEAVYKIETAHYAEVARAYHAIDTATQEA